jgi:hypothetical protein
MALPPAQLEHAIPGRMRLRVPSRRGDARYFARVAEHLQGQADIITVTTRAVTGSVLILHRSAPETIAAFAREQGLFDLAPGVVRRAGQAARASRAKALPWLGGAAAAFGAAGIYQALRGRLGSNAIETLWNAYNARSELKRPWLAALLAGMTAYNLAGRRVLPSAPSLLYFAATAWNFARRHPNARVSDVVK